MRIFPIRTRELYGIRDWKKSENRYDSGITSSRLLDLVDMSCLTEGDHSSDANVFHCGTRRLEVVAWIELLWGFHQDFSDGAGDRHTAIGIDIDFTDATLDTALDFFDGNSPCLFHLSTELVDDVL